MVAHCGHGAVCEIVQLRFGLDEVDVGVGQGKQPNLRICLSPPDRLPSALGRSPETRTGDSGQKRETIAEVHIGRLMAHAEAVGDPPHAQFGGGSGGEFLEGRRNKAILERLLQR